MVANHILLHPGTAPTPRSVIKGRSQGDSFSATALLWVLRAGCPISLSLTSGGHGETHPVLPGLREGIENEKQRDDDDAPCIKSSVQLSRYNSVLSFSCDSRGNRLEVGKAAVICPRPAGVSSRAKPRRVTFLPGLLHDANTEPALLLQNPGSHPHSRSLG